LLQGALPHATLQPAEQLSMNYTTQFKKIENAYHQYKLTVDCINSNFVGTLLNNNPDWAMVIKMPMNVESLNRGLCAIETESDNFYSIKDIFALDRKWRTCWRHLQSKRMPREDALHKTLFVTIKLLREIHAVNGQQPNNLYLPKRKNRSGMKLSAPVDLLSPRVLCMRA
jgi:hypothetical protein